MNYLKEIGEYDDATILITSDHGSDHGSWQLDTPEKSPDLQNIFFIKKTRERHDEMKISSAPVCSCDILPTILDIIGLDYTEYGTSIYDWVESDKRERTIYMLSYNTLNGWTYTDKEELLQKDLDKPDISYNTDMY